MYIDYIQNRNKIFTFTFRDNTSEMLSDDKELDEYCRQSNYKSLMGSISHRFVNTIEHLNSQYNYFNLEMATDEIILLQVI